MFTHLFLTMAHFGQNWSKLVKVRAGHTEALIKTKDSRNQGLKPGQTKDNVKVEPRQKPSPEQNSGLVEPGCFNRSRVKNEHCQNRGLG